MKQVWMRLTDIFERLGRLGAVLAELCLVTLLLLVFHEVIARYVLNKPTLYSVEISEYLLIFVAFMAAGWVLQEDRHVRMNSVVDLLPPKVQRVLDIATSAAVLCFCAILVWQGTKSSIMAFKGDYHSSSLLNVPLWIPYAVIPTGSLLLAMQLVVRIGNLISATTPQDHS